MADRDAGEGAGAEYSKPLRVALISSGASLPLLTLMPLSLSPACNCLQRASSRSESPVSSSPQQPSHAPAPLALARWPCAGPGDVHARPRVRPGPVHTPRPPHTPHTPPTCTQTWDIAHGDRDGAIGHSCKPPALNRRPPACTVYCTWPAALQPAGPAASTQCPEADLPASCPASCRVVPHLGPLGWQARPQHHRGGAHQQLGLEQLGLEQVGPLGPLGGREEGQGGDHLGA